MSAYVDVFGKPHELPRGVKPTARRSVYGIAVRDGKLLVVVSTWSDKYDLPGGRAREGESDEEALKREFMEETGYCIRLLDDKPLHSFRGCFYANDRGKYFNVKGVHYRVESVGAPDATKIRRDEIRSVSFISLKELSQENCTHVHWPAVQKLLMLQTGK